MEQSTPSSYTCSWVFLNPKYHYKNRLGDLHDGEVRAGLIDCLERMVPSHVDQLEIHRQLTIFNMASGTFGKNLAKMARDVDQPGKQFQFPFCFSFQVKIVYVLYNSNYKLSY